VQITISYQKILSPHLKFVNPITFIFISKNNKKGRSYQNKEEKNQRRRKMEVSLASTCLPLTFNSNKKTLLNHNNNIFHSQIPTLKFSTKQRTTIVNSIRPTLSSNWLVSHDLSAQTASPWLPKFEELDTTNVLLRQRIVFLGSQVINLLFFDVVLWVPFCLFLMFLWEIYKLFIWV